MELKLLAPPTDSPFRIQPTRGLPSEGSFAVNTSALPRSLPQTLIDPSAGTAPWEMLARLGSTGVQVSTHLGGILAEAEARKNEADTVAEASGLYTQLVLGFDQTVEQLKVSTDHRSLRPAYEAAWKEAADTTFAKASNPRVAERLSLKAAGYRVTKSAEIADTTRQKFVGYHTAALATDIEGLQKQATDAATAPEYDRYTRDIETRFLEAAHTGIFKPEVLNKMRAETLGDIKIDRAMELAHVAPLSMLERLSRGEFDDLSKKERLNLAQRAENQIRTLRSDQENADARVRRQAAVEQDDKAIGWRQKISANYGTGGPGMDLSQDISTDARGLGKENHAAILEMHRTYRDRFLDPGKAPKSNPDVVGAAQYAIVTGRLDQISQADLLRSFKAKELDETDYTRLSGLLDSKLQAQRSEGNKAKTDAEQFREKQTKDAEKNIDAYLTRGNRFAGDVESQRTDILIRDAITELHIQLQKDSNANPIDVADELIKRRIRQADEMKQTLPYTDQGDVLAAYSRGDIDKATATRYFRLLEERKKTTTPGNPSPAGTDVRKPEKTP